MYPFLIIPYEGFLFYVSAEKEKQHACFNVASPASLLNFSCYTNFLLSHRHAERRKERADLSRAPPGSNPPVPSSSRRGDDRLILTKALSFIII